MTIILFAVLLSRKLFKAITVENTSHSNIHDILYLFNAKENRKCGFKNRIIPQGNNLRSSPIKERSEILRIKKQLEPYLKKLHINAT